MSNDERPEFRALEDLKTVAAHISQELGAFRRRAKQAEAAQAETGVGGDLRARIEELQAENADLNARVEQARDRVSELLARLRFLEEQMSTEQASP